MGKTELAKALARAWGGELIRLQCYEGLDEAKALYEWEYAKQLLYTQMLKDKIGDLMVGAASLAEAVDRMAASGRGVLLRALPAAPAAARRRITPSDAAVLLLIDEVDKADPEFEAFLLEVLADYAGDDPRAGHHQGAAHPAGSC